MGIENLLIVDDSELDLYICDHILAPHYNTTLVHDVSKMFNFLETNKVDLILMDINMPITDGFEALKMLQASESYTNIPVILITGDERADTEVEALNMGAVDVITKPLKPELLLSHVKIRLTLARRREELKKLSTEMFRIAQGKIAELMRVQNGILDIVAGLIEFRDFTTGKHIVHTRSYLDCLLKRMISEHCHEEEILAWDYDMTILASRLHDVGKIGISDIILNKEGRLTDEEYIMIQGHVEIGVRIIDYMIKILGSNTFLLQARKFVQYHHERWDGTGYPLKIAGENIPLEGRVLSIIDVYDALTSERPYKKPLSHEAAYEIINRGSGTQFDPQIIEIFNLIYDDLLQLNQ
jgi:putative two-component system response regulator